MKIPEISGKICRPTRLPLPTQLVNLRQRRRTPLQIRQKLIQLPRLTFHLNRHAPADVAATLYQAIGIRPDTLLHDRQGRPLAVLPEGEPIPGVL